MAKGAVLTVRGTPVTAIMTRRIEMVAASMPVSHAAHIMLDKEITGMPVTDDEGAFIGVVSAADLLRAVSGSGSSPPPASRGFYTDIRPSVLYDADFIRGNLQGTVKDYMSTFLVSVPTEATVQEAAQTMVESGVSRVLVLDRNGNLAGIVTASDVVRHVAG
jgi:CBS domain-containing protein